LIYFVNLSLTVYKCCIIINSVHKVAIDFKSQLKFRINLHVKYQARKMQYQANRNQQQVAELK